MTESIPYDPKKINILAQVISHDKDNVEKAINAGIELGLITILESGEMWMTEIQNYIGKSSNEADRKREYRLRLGQMSGQISDKSPPEIEIEREIKKEKEIDKDALFYTKIFYDDLMTTNDITKYKNNKPNLNKWSEHLKFLSKTIDYDTQHKVWLWAMKDNFWSSNILSTKKFREKFDTLKIQMNNNKQQNKIDAHTVK